MTEPLHCRECDDISCPGFTTPRATPEPVSALRPDRVATAAQRQKHIDDARAQLAAVKHREQEEGR